MDIRLTKGTASVDALGAISSKSYVHRLIIAASLYGGNADIITNIMSKDMEATIGAINALGGDVSEDRTDDGRIIIRVRRLPGKNRLPSCTIHCGESGSTARFILPVAACVAKSATVTGSGRLPDRPMGPLCEVLRKAGVSVSSDHLPITVSGMPVSGDYTIAGDVSSQFISGLLFALPLLDGPSNLTVTGKFESAAYVDMTVDVLSKFGVRIIYENGTFHINGKEGSGPNGYVSPAVIEAEGDWSNAAYLMAMAALGSGRMFDGFTVTGLNPDSVQGDRAVVDIMERYGIGVRCDGKGGYEIKGCPMRSVDVDCAQIPDLVPALAVIAAYADGDSIFRNVERLRMKECDRVDAISEMLSAVNVMVDIISHNGSEDMTVHGKGMNSPVSGEISIDSQNDHRIVMAAAAIALAEEVPVIIKDAMAVDKSYPGFFEDAAKIGLLYTEVI